ncbi:hypothetical protein F7725_014677 [Dissostichus mawsoni]|uniref:Uncharacterized protein n=1 Tax=Dissostichus mawsoni TaxID=36200 RepID=A0A7J5YYW4_DISMA|nr:hypothetical protein F7725_014677 [Dissostichus mawsoni]
MELTKLAEGCERDSCPTVLLSISALAYIFTASYGSLYLGHWWSVTDLIRTGAYCDSCHSIIGSDSSQQQDTWFKLQL